MGLLIDGKWSDQWYTPDETGHFIRSEAIFRDQITADGSSGFKAEAGRYHLYISHACPWCTRVVILRKLKGLEKTISMSVVDPFMGGDGWFFSDGPGCVPDTVNNKQFMYEIYTEAMPDYTGRVTVPVLWDKQTNAIVNNESREIIRMFDNEFEAFAKNNITFCPAAIEKQTDQAIDAIYEPINNGVYRTGFAATQEAYEEALTEMFAALDHWNEVLGKQRYMVGDTITEADWCLFVTLFRFDSVYVAHFKCNLRRIQDYPNLWNYVKDLYQISGIAECCDMSHIKNHYFRSHPMINPAGIVPVGPIIDFNAAHDRNRFANKEFKLETTK